MKVNIPSEKSLKLLIEKSLRPIHTKINKMHERILELEEENRKLRFEK